jgi:hypothetical protein
MSDKPPRIFITSINCLILLSRVFTTYSDNHKKSKDKCMGRMHRFIIPRQMLYVVTIMFQKLKDKV